VEAGVVARLRFEDLVIGRAVAEWGGKKVKVDYCCKRYELGGWN
jgi:hypothetical protein